MSDATDPSSRLPTRRRSSAQAAQGPDGSLSERSETTRKREGGHEPTDDIMVCTPGLSDAELAAVVTVVRGVLEEEIDERDGGPDAAAISARRWRHVWRGSDAPQREWR